MSTASDPAAPGGADRAAQHLDRLALGLVLASLVALALHKIIAYDLWWQLASGAWILEHGLPRVDPFSYGFPDRPWVELRWLYYLGIHALAAVGGLNALILAKVALLLASFALFAAATRAPARWITPPVLLLMLLLMASRLRVRPELMSFLWISVVLLCLERYKRGGSERWLLPLPIVAVLWSNTHTLWVLGPVLAGSAALCEWLQGRAAGSVPLLAGDPHPIRGARLRYLGWTALALVACGFATPYLLDGALYPLTLMRQIHGGSAVARMIAELHSPLYYAGPSLWFTTWVAAVLLSGLSFWLCPERFVLARFVWWLGFLYLSVLSQRNISLFGIVAGIALAGNLRDWSEAPDRSAGRLRRAAPWAARFGVLAVAGALPGAAASDWFWRVQGMDQSFGFGVVERRVPIRALAFVEEMDLPRPVIGDMAAGGYILHRGGPRSTFVDGRLEVYGEENLLRVLEIMEDGNALLRTAREHGVHTAILRHPDQQSAIQTLEAHRGWVPVYFDEGFVVYVERDGATAPRVDALAIDWRQPVRREVTVPALAAPRDWLAGIPPRVPDVTGLRNVGYLLLLVDSLEPARDAFAEVLRRRPRDVQARLHLGILEHALGRPEAARASLAGLDPELLESSGVLALRSHLALRRGRRAEAQAFLEGAIGAAPESAPELRELAALAQRLGHVELAQTLLARAAALPDPFRGRP